MKKIFSLFLTFIILFTSSVNAFAVEEAEENQGYEITPADFTLEVGSAVLMEAETGTVLFSQNADVSAPPASVTKVMTLLVACERVTSLDYMLTIEKRHIDYL